VLREQIGHNGRQLVEQSFDWEQIARGMRDALEQPPRPLITAVNNYPIVPLQFGGQYRIYNLYWHLAEHFDICYLCFDHTQSHAYCQTIRENFYQIAIPEERLHRLSERVCVRFFGKSMDDVLAIFFSKWNFQFKRLLRDCAGGSAAVIASHCYLFHHLCRYRQLTRIHEAHNVEADLKGELFKGLSGRLISWWVRRLEGGACRKSSAVFCVSKDDMERLQTLYQASAPCYVFPNGVDTSFIQPIPASERETYKREIGLETWPVVFFIGSAHGPNIDAADFIIRELAAGLPDFLFFVAGSVCWGVKDPPPPPNVKLFYEVDRVIARELLRLADFAVNPMASGSGTNIKMADFLAAGLPTVATPIGARGLDIVDGTHAIVCERSDFITQLRRLQADPCLAEALGRNARQLATAQYDWKMTAERMAETLAALLRRKPTPDHGPGST
jgi:glycosyltransferase involved in cell wall biosynthesis